MKKTTPPLIVLLTMSVIGSAAASEIYRWTDENGNTQYGDRPTEDAVRVTAIQSSPTDNSRIIAATAARQKQQAEKAEIAARNQGPSEEELRAEAAERKGKCVAFRGQLQKLITSRRLFREDDNGERVYLAEDEMQAAREKVQNQVEEYCSG